MKTIKPLPTQSRLWELLTYNKDTGIFGWRVITKNRHETAGCVDNKGYVKIYIDGSTYKAHRLAWVYVHGSIPTGKQIDHKNRKCGDNRIENLRIATHSQNCANSIRHKKMLPKGIRLFNGRYQARIQVDKNNIHLGTFDTPELAHSAYADAARKYFGNFARA